MIRLTRTNGTAIYMNPDKIISFNEDDGETFIDYGYDRYIVTEPATEVARKVSAWRLAMIDYHHDIPSVKTNAMAELVRLAGLEEPNHD